MKTSGAKANRSGLTLIEVLLIIAVIAILAAMFLPTLAHSGKSPVIACLNNLKQIDIGFQIFVSDNGGSFPMQLSATNGGTMEFVSNGHVFLHFQKLSKDFLYPRIFVCPLDKTRQPATNYEALNDLNISYFLNADVSTNNPTRSILSGDSFLQVNGQPVKPGLFIFTTNQNVSWASGFHANAKRGNLAFADGHVENIRKETLNSIIQQQPLATNRFCIP